MALLYIFGSVLLVSLLSIIAAIPLLLKKKVSDKTLLFLLSVSVGVLLSSVFINFLPEAVSEKYTLGVAIYVLVGFLMMFVIEKFVHHHHSKKCENGDCGHGHAYNVAPMNLLGDAVHNFIDGIVIAGAYTVNIALGITATISIIFHELPQEIADFGVLLYSGLSKKKALIFNLMSALTSVFGAVFGIILAGRVDGFNAFIIPFAAGNFLYIAASNLLPQLHRHCNLKDSLLHLFAIVLGIMIIIAVTLFGPAHVH